MKHATPNDRSLSLFYVFFSLSVVPPTKLLDMKHLTPSEKKAAQAQAYELYTVFGTGVCV
jgi:hypothetical protein